MRLSLLLLAATHALANGPAWVAELSAVAPQHLDNITVHTTPGQHATVGIYDTDAIAPEDVPGIKATIRVQWFEHRTVFSGMAEERMAAIPYYLPEPKDLPPTGSWALELEPERVGVYTVPVACNTNTVTVTVVCMDLPESGIGYGFYSDYALFPDPLRGRDYYRDMAAHGMNTLTPYSRELPQEYGVDNKDHAALLSWHIDTAIDVGLCDPRFPLLCLSCSPQDITNSRATKRNAQWPELVAANKDEPLLEHGEIVKGFADAAHAEGLLSGTAIVGPTAKEIGGPLDVWILSMETTTQETMKDCADKGKQRWVYNCTLRGSNAALHRYWTGVYTWAIGPRVCLTWNYMHDPSNRINPDGSWNLLRVYDTATCDAQGKPIPTVALEGMADGIVDSRLLQALAAKGGPEAQAYLDKLRAQVPLTFWPDGHNRDYGPYVWDVPDMAVPPVDLVAMRAEVLRLLRGVER